MSDKQPATQAERLAWIEGVIRGAGAALRDSREPVHGFAAHVPETLRELAETIGAWRERDNKRAEDAPTLDQIRNLLRECAGAPEPRHIWRVIGYLDKVIGDEGGS